MDRSKEKGTFKGSVNELLKHCSNIDVDELYDQCEKRECLSIIMRETNCSEEEAELLYIDIALNDVKDTVDSLVEEGLVEISGFNKDGEPLFVLTELGKKVQNEINKNNK
jgi:hypothetical protein